MKLAFAPALLAVALLALPGCNQKEFAALQQQNAELARTRDQLMLEKTALANEKAQSEATLRGSLLNKSNQVNQLNSTLGTTEQDLAGKTARIAEMQRILDQKDAATKALRQRVADALLGFNAQDVAVNVKNGKVYVSLSEQLLFKSGST